MKRAELGKLVAGALVPGAAVGLLALAVLRAPSCGSGARPAPEPGVAEVSASVAAPRVDAGQPVELTVSALLSEGWSVALTPPRAEGLTASKASERGPLPRGARQVRETTWHLEGPDGSYVVVPAAGVATGPAGEEQQLEVAPIFVDIGADGPRAQGLADFEQAPAPAPTPWLLLAAAAAGASLVGGLATAWWLWGRPPPPPEVPDPPEVLARRAWLLAREAGLDDHGLALALSRILREYYERITGWPATARTTREILAHMDDRGLLPADVRLRARRVLDATDLLKFAREGGGQGFFEPLEQDFEAVLVATSPGPAAHRPSAPAHEVGGA